MSTVPVRTATRVAQRLTNTKTPDNSPTSTRNNSTTIVRRRRLKVEALWMNSSCIQSGENSRQRAARGRRHMTLCTFCKWSVLAWMLRRLGYGFTLSIHYNSERKGRYIPYNYGTNWQWDCSNQIAGTRRTLFILRSCLQVHHVVHHTNAEAQGLLRAMGSKRHLLTCSQSTTRSRTRMLYWRPYKESAASNKSHDQKFCLAL
jgi:hypothetical protein